MSKQTSPEMSSLAARVLGGYEPSRAEIKSLAASVLSQDTTPGQRIKHAVKHAVEKVKALVGRGSR